MRIAVHMSHAERNATRNPKPFWIDDRNKSTALLLDLSRCIDTFKHQHHEAEGKRHRPTLFIMMSLFLKRLYLEPKAKKMDVKAKGTKERQSDHVVQSVP